MIKIINTYLLNKTRPLHFCKNVKLEDEEFHPRPEKCRRDYSLNAYTGMKFPEKIKDDNPIISINNSVKYH